jgi:large subunit ribosomal protein L30
MAKRLKVTQLKSKIGNKPNQRETLRSLGLKRIGDIIVKEDSLSVRGMVNTVAHLVKVEAVSYTHLRAHETHQPISVVVSCGR